MTTTAQKAGFNYSRIFILLFVGTALGCILWLTFFKDAHLFRRELSQEDRAAVAVAAVPLPSAKLVIILPTNQFCYKVERAEVDGSDYLLYVRNTCAHRERYAELHI